MSHTLQAGAVQAHYELRFADLFNRGRGYAFPCDTQGHVDMNALSERGRCNYFYARVVVGHQLSMPLIALVD